MSSTPPMTPLTQDYHVPRFLLQKYAKAGPRYTSYPTAPVWHNDFTAADARAIYAGNNFSDPGDQVLEQVKPHHNPLAVYVHLPFCQSLCWYCGCNTKIARNKKVLLPYLTALRQEIQRVSPYLAADRQVTQMHWGGGTPTYLSPEQIVALVKDLKAAMVFSPDAELSIEVDPRVTHVEHLEALRESGFNRISMGLQDFNPDVQEAIHRVQPYEMTAELITKSRELGFRSVNVDLIYGLPLQSTESFAETLAQVKTLDPDRLALFHYAHMPWARPAQKLIKDVDLPSSAEKLNIFEMTIDTLLADGYRYIGMDHFAKPDDELSLAQEARTLRRNFMGYTTQAGVDLYGFGASSISEIDGHFIQNHREVPDYENALAAGDLPTARGLRLTPEDHLRKAVIEALICNGYLDFEQMSQGFGVDFEAHFAPALHEAEAMARDGLLTFEGRALRVLPRGQILIRNICMLFDAYLSQAGARTFSQTA